MRWIIFIIIISSLYLSISLIYFYCIVSFFYCIYILELLVEIVWAMFGKFSICRGCAHSIVYLYCFLLYSISLWYLLSKNALHSPLLCPFDANPGTSVIRNGWFVHWKLTFEVPQAPGCLQASSYFRLCLYFLSESDLWVFLDILSCT